MDPDLMTAAGCRPLRVLVVDDQRLVRAALRSTLEETSDILVVGEAADAGECVEVCAAVRPDVVLVDLAGRGTDALDATRRLCALDPCAQVMFVTAAVDGDLLQRALDAGAVGYLLADVGPHALRDAVRAVARGESPLDPRAVRAMLRARPAVRGDDLTAREREVLALVMLGLANKQIARELEISDRTVKAHIGSIFARIGVTDRTSAAVWAERNLRPERDAPPDRTPQRPDRGARPAAREVRRPALDVRLQPVTV